MENKKTFDEKMKYLETLVSKLNDSNLSFEETMKIYEESILLSNELKKEIDQAMKKVSIISENGNLEDF